MSARIGVLSASPHPHLRTDWPWETAWPKLFHQRLRTCQWPTKSPHLSRLVQGFLVGFPPRYFASRMPCDSPSVTTTTAVQWRHTLGTRLINKDVPQEVVRRILDHDSAQMTSHYARLHDTTVRRH